MWWHFNFKKRWQSYQKTCLKTLFLPVHHYFQNIQSLTFLIFFLSHFNPFYQHFFCDHRAEIQYFAKKEKICYLQKIEFFTTFGFYRLEHFSPPHLIIPWNNLNSNSQNSIPLKKLNVYEMRLFEAKNDYTKTWYECVVQKNLHLLV